MTSTSTGIIVLIIVLALGFLIGLWSGHITYDAVTQAEHNKYVDAFNQCRDKYNKECLGRNSLMIGEVNNFGINVTELVGE